MTSTRRIFALPIIGTALALIAFAIAIGAKDAGPGTGTRLTVMIESTSPEAREIAGRVIKERIDWDGVGGRMIPAGDRVIVELGTQDSAVIATVVELLERPAKPGVNMPAVPETAAAADAAAAPPLRVTRREPFTRATGFLPRVWPFLAIAGVMLVLAAWLWFSQRKK